MDVTAQAAQSVSIDALLQQHFDREFADRRTVARLSQHYRREGYVKIPNLVSAELKARVAQDVHRLIDAYPNRIDITMKATSNSPRKMTTVSCRFIMEESSLIAQIYHSSAMMGFLSRLARERVVLCPYEDERSIIIKQHEAGDTHGWHWGDFSFTVIWIIEAPGVEKGGMLQCVPHTDWDKSDPRVEQYLLDNPIRSYYHQSGDIYFLRSDTTLHRTVPLTEPTTRIILNTCWAGELDQERQSGHETMEAMFV